MTDNLKRSMPAVLDQIDVAVPDYVMNYVSTDPIVDAIEAAMRRKRWEQLVERVRVAESDLDRYRRPLLTIAAQMKRDADRRLEPARTRIAVVRELLGAWEAKHAPAPTANEPTAKPKPNATRRGYAVEIRDAAQLRERLRNLPADHPLLDALTLNQTKLRQLLRRSDGNDIAGQAGVGDLVHVREKHLAVAK